MPKVVDCAGPAADGEFTDDEIRACLRRRGLLSLEIEFPPAAALLEQLHEVLAQARELGARQVVISGAQPGSGGELQELIDGIVGAGMAAVLVADAAGLTPALAGCLAARRATVVLNANFATPDLLAGDDGSAFGRALTCLRQAGYPGPDGRRLVLRLPIRAGDLDALPASWRQARSLGIEPWVKTALPGSGPAVPSEQIRELFAKLSAIDRDEFGRRWTPQPPMAGHACRRPQYACRIGADGQVYPCAGIAIPVGDLRGQPLRTILDKSEVLDDLRRGRQTVKDPCAACELADVCCGCRGAAFLLTGDYLAADPQCWRNAGADIPALPLVVGSLIPHGPGIRFVHRLLRLGELEAELDALVPSAGPFLDEQGRLDACAFPEMLAQGIAASHGFRLSTEDRRRHRGFLLGIKDFTVSGEARAGETLQVKLRQLVRIENFGVVGGTVARHGQELARGEIKVWQSRDDAPLAKGAFA